MGKRGSSRSRRWKQRRERARKRGLDLSISAMFVLAVYFALFGGEFSLFEFRKIKALRAERAAELARTEAVVDSLQRLADRLEDDPEEIERVARERYGMIREGEILYRFRDGWSGAGIDRPESPE